MINNVLIKVKAKQPGQGVGHKGWLTCKHLVIRKVLARLDQSLTWGVELNYRVRVHFPIEQKGCSPRKYATKWSFKLD